MVRRALGLLSVCAALLASGEAYGQNGKPGPAEPSGQAQAVARLLFNEGVALMGERRFAEACPKLEASLERFPGLGTRGKLAECYERAGRTASAWRTYREVARLAARAGEPTREQVASERAKALEPRLSYLTVAAPASEVPGLVVRRNGTEVTVGAAEPVDAGLVQVEATAPGRKPYTTQLVVGEGLTARVEVPALESLASPSAPAPLSSGPKPPDSATLERRPADEPPPGEPTWQRPVGLALGGAGVLAIGIGGALALAARSSYESAFDDGLCERGTLRCGPEGQGETDDARATATTASVVMGVGAAAAIGGLVLYVTAPSRPKSALRVVPSVSTTGATLSVGGSL